MWILWHIIARGIIFESGIPEREEKKKGEEWLTEEINTENFPRWRRETSAQTQEGKGILKNKAQINNLNTHLKNLKKE